MPVAGPGIGGIVLAGGAGRRMGGVDKAALAVDGVTLLDRVLTAARPVCDQLVVVGPTRPTGVAGVSFVTEAAPGGGPVPAVLAGVDACPRCDLVLVLAVDLPLLRSEDLRRLLVAVDQPGVDAAASGEGRGPNPLLAAYRVPALLARAGDPALGAGARAGRLLPASTVTVDLGPAALNVNRPEDLAAAASAAVAGNRPGHGDEDAGEPGGGGEEDRPTDPREHRLRPE